MIKSFRKFLPKAVGFKLNMLYSVRPKSAVEQSFRLFCTPRRGRATREQEHFLQPAKFGKTKSGDQTFQTYHWPGTKERVLLLHGWESNSFRWKNLIGKLQRDDFSIFAMDAPAHGNSSGKLFNVPLYSNWLEKAMAEFDPHYVVAHSLGAMTLVFNLYTAPKKSNLKLVLLGSPSELLPLMNDFQKTLELSPRLMMGLEKRFIEKFGYSFNEFSVAQFAKSLDQKTLIVHDKYDRTIPVSASMDIHANWKNSNLILTEGAGHSLNNDYVHNEISEFLKT